MQNTEQSETNTNTPLLKLREMILSGELYPGERITEASLADRLGVSRTPIRSALLILDSDGYIEPAGKRGYVVKHFSAEESFKGLEMRAALEGIAAKYLIEKGVSRELLAELHDCLKQGDDIVRKRYLVEEDEDLYAEMNARFHNLIVHNCGAPILINTIERLNKMPFISPSVLVFAKIGLDQAYNILFRAHGQHHAIVDALIEGDSARAESIFREHGNAQRRSLFSRADLREKKIREKQKDRDCIEESR